MGELERKSGRRKKNADVRRIILQTVAVAGVLSIAVVAPNVIAAMGRMGLIPGKRQGESIHRARKRLVEQGLLKYHNNHVQLTEKGVRALRLFKIKDYQIKKPRRWDGRWRMLIFDIPEKKKSLRERIRLTLIRIGFIRLQDSVWLYPYDCEELITLLKADFKIGKDVLYMIVDTLEYDNAYRKYFDLPLG